MGFYLVGIRDWTLVCVSIDFFTSTVIPEYVLLLADSCKLPLWLVPVDYNFEMYRSNSLYMGMKLAKSLRE